MPKIEEIESEEWDYLLYLTKDELVKIHGSLSIRPKDKELHDSLWEQMEEILCCNESTEEGD